jgi:hypothetical protein
MQVHAGEVREGVCNRTTGNMAAEQSDIAANSPISLLLSAAVFRY